MFEQELCKHFRRRESAYEPRDWRIISLENDYIRKEGTIGEWHHIEATQERRLIKELFVLLTGIAIDSQRNVDSHTAQF